uniref:AP2/ERF domain-containing protein n=1 Tax=Leersia perrieri TaxID=77586 RepID=A0A0D9XDZ5_9ORYZ
MAAIDAVGKKRGGGQQQQHRKSIDTFGQTSSQYRGVTRWTGKYEAHFWDNSFKKEGQAKKGRQGGYDTEEKAARAYDLATLKYWGHTTHINFPLEQYQEDLEFMKNMNKEQYVAHIRRHHQQGRWQARIGRVEGNKDLYLGTFATQEEAAEVYDVAAIKFRGRNTVTN